MLYPFYTNGTTYFIVKLSVLSLAILMWRWAHHTPKISKET